MRMVSNFIVYIVHQLLGEWSVKFYRSRKSFNFFLHFSLDRDGNVEGINYSVPQRDSRFSISIDKVDEWYKAKAKFVELIHEEAVTFKTKPGKKSEKIK